jgi:4-amino-4-deoxy-L-arabinose transferase-like glycosyltransferase
MSKQSVQRARLRPSAVYFPSAEYSKPKIADPFARGAAAAIVAVMLAQTVFLVWGCDWDLCSDEAEFWAWSRKLDWSYFARGPAIAWLIRLGTVLLGGISLKLTGSLMFAVRFPCVILGGLTAWAVYRLTILTTRSTRIGLIAVLLLPAIPIFALGGVVVTCDTPLVCCWAWAAVWTYRAVQNDDLNSWLVAGLIGVIGVLAKYSFLAFPASVGLFLLVSADKRRQLKRPGFWLMSLLTSVLGLLPIVVWNTQHGWVGANQLADRVGLSSRATWLNFQPVFSFLGGETIALGLIWWIVGIGALLGVLTTLVRSRRNQAGEGAPAVDEGLSISRTALIYLLSLWGVLWCACLVASVLGETEVNWMVPGYVGLIVLIATRVERVRLRGGPRRLAYAAAWCFLVAAVVAAHHLEWFYPAIARWVPAPTRWCAAPFRLYEPTARFRGHQAVAQAVAEKVRALEAQGESPFVLTATYGLTSALSFYLPGQPETYCLGWNYGMTQAPVNQHDLWHPNPRHDPEAFKNRPAIVVEDSNMPPSVSWHMHKKGVFRKLESSERLIVRKRGVIIGAWDIAICREYSGLAGYRQNKFSQSKPQVRVR